MPVMPGHAWACLVMPGHAWSCLGMPGHAWSCLGMPDHAWSCLVMLGRHSFSCLMLGHAWSCLAMPNHAWSCMVMPGHGWSCFVLAGHAWLSLVTFQHIWSCIMAGLAWLWLSLTSGDESLALVLSHPVPCCAVVKRSLNIQGHEFVLLVVTIRFLCLFLFPVWYPKSRHCGIACITWRLVQCARRLCKDRSPR